MSNLVAVIKALAIPAVISLILFLLSTHVLVPLYRRYHARYAQYLPLDTLSHRTESLRGRIAHWIAARRRRLMVGGDSDDEDDGVLRSDGDDEEELTVVDALAMGIPTRGIVRGEDYTRRLSRDLEEGFRDDSDDEGHYPATSRRS